MTARGVGRGAALVLAGLLVGVLAAGVVAVGQAGAAADYPVGTQADGLARWLADPLSAPAGVDPAHCTPDVAHPDPVILLPGTFVRVAEGFAALGPTLADRGLCVYGLNYGDTVLSVLSGGRAGAVGDIDASARQLAARVEQVRAATGAHKVDLVGWSEGGLVSRSYLATPGAPAHVGRVVMLSTPNEGTDVDGSMTALSELGVIGTLGAVETAGHVSALSLLGCDACDQMLTGSAYLSALNTDPAVVPGVDYTVVTTARNLINTPEAAQTLPGARNVSVGQECPGDDATDLTVPYDPVAIQLTLQGLGVAPVGPVACGGTAS